MNIEEKVLYCVFFYNQILIVVDESLFSSIPLAFVYPFDSFSVLNCLSLVCFHLLDFIGHCSEFGLISHYLA